MDPFFYHMGLLDQTRDTAYVLAKVPPVWKRTEMAPTGLLQQEDMAQCSQYTAQKDGPSRAGRGSPRQTFTNYFNS